MLRLESSEVRQLKLFAWFLLIVNTCIAGVGYLFGRSLEDHGDGALLALVVALLVNAAFLIVVGGDLIRLAVASVARRISRSTGAEEDIP